MKAERAWGWLQRRRFAGIVPRFCVKPERAWVRLQSGRRLNLLEPDPTSWTDSDLAIGLSRTYRWGGHSRWDLPLSVAQHSLLVMVLRQKLRPLEPLTPGEALRELLHDADEGLLSYDPISPIKPHLGPDFRALSGRMQEAVQTRYGVQPWDDQTYAIHKQADRLAAASEAMHVAGWSAAELHETLEIDIPPLTADPLPAPNGMRPWEPWPAKTAAALFLAKLQELTAPAGGCDSEDITDIAGAIARERTISEVGAAFTRLPPGSQRRCAWPLTGNSLTDTLVLVEAGDHSACIEGVVVDGERDDDGAWDFDAPFTVLTVDEELIVCRGDCYVEIQ
jgi:5'-deoxynucleotidase YfbR-like HD superfamily hydrolase